MLNNRIIKLLIWVFLYLLFLELILNIGGMVFTLKQDFLNKIHLKQENVYKIMCIGDSMTAVGGQDAYPTKLENILKENLKSVLDKSNINIKVINKGIPAAKSSKITDSLEGYVSEYKPDMVVVMMGATNQGGDSLSVNNTGLMSNLDRTLDNLKTYRLFKKFLLQAIRQVSVWTKYSPVIVQPKPVASIQDQGQPVTPQDLYLFLYAMHLRDDVKDYAKAEMVFKYILSLGLDKGFTDRAIGELAHLYDVQKRYDDMIPLIKRLLSEYDYDRFASGLVNEICSVKSEETSIIPMLSDLVVQNPESIALNRRLAECYEAYDHPEKAQIFFDKADALYDHWDNAQLRHDYLRVHEILKEHGIKEVFVQYPNKSVQTLMKFFRLLDADNIIFVSNEANFKLSHDPGKYNQYFTERIFVDFGHCTPYGNYILAKQVAQTIKPYLEKILK